MLLRTFLSLFSARTQEWIAGSQDLFMVSYSKCCQFMRLPAIFEGFSCPFIKLSPILVILAYLVDSSQVLIVFECEVGKLYLININDLKCVHHVEYMQLHILSPNCTRC